MNDSLVWKRRLGRGYSLLRRFRDDSAQCGLVLTYHSVGPTTLGLPAENFRAQMQWLRENSAVVDLGTLLNGEWPKSASGITCAITFDDGYASVYRDAFPVLQDLELPATVYLVGEAIGGSKPKTSSEFPGLYPDEEMLLWNEVREMAKHRVSFGSHLMRHKDLTSLSKQEAEAELRQSKELIEDSLGVACADFCYPWGRHNGQCIRAVRDAGYRDAVSTIQSRWKRTAPPDPYRVPRADVRREYSLDDFAAVVRGDWDYLGYLQTVRGMLH